MGSLLSETKPSLKSGSLKFDPDQIWSENTKTDSELMAPILTQFRRYVLKINSYSLVKGFLTKTAQYL